MSNSTMAPPAPADSSEQSVPTQRQLDAYDELTRLVTDADDPGATARRLLDLIESEKVRADRGSEWVISTRNGVTVTGYLPAWADEDPSETGVAADRLELHLSDITFHRGYPGQTVTIDTGAYEGDDGKRYVGAADVLCPQIDCAPFDDDPSDRVPMAHVELMAGSDDWIHGLDPAGVTDLAAKLRSQADRLDQVATDLAAYRTDWDAKINEQVARKHPHMKPVTNKATTACVYEGSPSVEVRTGQLGNRYGLCAECAETSDAMDAGGWAAQVSA